MQCQQSKRKIPELVVGWEILNNVNIDRMENSETNVLNVLWY